MVVFRDGEINELFDLALSRILGPLDAIRHARMKVAPDKIEGLLIKPES
jgi:hypothetical protein